MATEETYIEQAKAGDLDAFSELVKLYEKRVYHFTLKFLHNPEDAMDLSQETFLRVFRSLSLFRGQSSFSTWVFSIAHNLCIDFMRKQKRRGLHKPHVNEDDPEMLSIPDTRFDPVSTYEKREINSEIDRALGAITPDLREIFLLREVAGLQYQEIADALDIELGTVKSRIARARAALAKELQDLRNKPAQDASKDVKGR